MGENKSANIFVAKKAFFIRGKEIIDSRFLNLTNPMVGL